MDQSLGSLSLGLKWNLKKLNYSVITRFLLLHTGCFLCPTKSNSFSPPPQLPQENYCRKVCLDTNTYHFWVDEMGTQPCPDHPWHYAWPSLAEGSRDSVCGIFNSPFPTLSPPTPLSCQTGSVKHFTPGPSQLLPPNSLLPWKLGALQLCQLATLGILNFLLEKVEPNFNHLKNHW